MPDNQSPAAERMRRQSTVFGLVLLVVLAPVLVLVFGPMWLVAAIWFISIFVVLQVGTALSWLPRGRRVVFVYSNSPVWRDYVEKNILPRLPANAVVLNWSERRDWPSWSLAVWLFNVYGGSREYNPIALVVRPLLVPKRFRFWRAFRDYKHGKTTTIQKVEREFFEYIAPDAPRR